MAGVMLSRDHRVMPYSCCEEMILHKAHLNIRLFCTRDRETQEK
jgi:hypothetical protein